MKFSIRDLLLVTVIVALAVGWGVDRFRANKRVQEANRKVDEKEWALLQWQMSVVQLRDILRSEGWSVEIDEQGGADIESPLRRSSPLAPKLPKE